MTRDEFRERYVKRMVGAGVDDEAMMYYIQESAEVAWEQWSDPDEGLQDLTPEEMADEERDCWE